MSKVIFIDFDRCLPKKGNLTWLNTIKKRFDFAQIVHTQESRKSDPDLSTPKLKGVSCHKGRAHEIAFWVYLHWPVEKFVILDTNPSMNFLNPYLVWVNPETGICGEHMNKIQLTLASPLATHHNWPPLC